MHVIQCQYCNANIEIDPAELSFFQHYMVCDQCQGVIDPTILSNLRREYKKTCKQAAQREKRNKQIKDAHDKAIREKEEETLRITKQKQAEKDFWEKQEQWKKQEQTALQTEPENKRSPLLFTEWEKSMFRFVLWVFFAISLLWVICFAIYLFCLFCGFCGLTLGTVIGIK